MGFDAWVSVFGGHNDWFKSGVRVFDGQTTPEDIVVFPEVLNGGLGELSRMPARCARKCCLRQNQYYMFSETISKHSLAELNFAKRHDCGPSRPGISQSAFLRRTGSTSCRSLSIPVLFHPEGTSRRASPSFRENCRTSTTSSSPYSLPEISRRFAAFHGTSHQGGRSEGRGRRQPLAARPCFCRFVIWNARRSRLWRRWLPVALWWDFTAMAARTMRTRRTASGSARTFWRRRLTPWLKPWSASKEASTKFSAMRAAGVKRAHLYAGARTGRNASRRFLATDSGFRPGRPTCVRRWEATDAEAIGISGPGKPPEIY